MKIPCYIFFLSMLINLTAYSQETKKNFEGIITLKKINLNDTINITYYIKGSKIKIERYSAKQGALSSKVIDFKSNEIIIFKPNSKIYKKDYIQVKNSNKKISVNKTQNYKMINNRKCFQWIVKNKKDNTIVTYWVTKIYYKHYTRLLNILDETEKIPKYFRQIEGNEAVMPMLSVERSWLRDNRMSIKIEKIEKITINNSIFEIPKDYKIHN